MAGISRVRDTKEYKICSVFNLVNIQRHGETRMVLNKFHTGSVNKRGKKENLQTVNL